MAILLIDMQVSYVAKSFVAGEILYHQLRYHVLSPLGKDLHYDIALYIGLYTWHRYEREVV